MCRLAQAGLASAVACTPAACCGGSSGNHPVVLTPPVVTPNSLTLTGTGNATSLANGNCNLNVSSGALPCVIKVTAADGTVLHSVASGSGSTAVVNISPLTELVLAQTAGGKPATLFASFDAAAQAKVSNAALATATTAVATALQSVLSLTGINPFTNTLVAATGSSAGNALDATLTAALASAQLSVADLGAAIVANGSAAAAVVASQVQPAAATCASARSGDYWVINPNQTQASDRLKKVAFNATTLTLTQPDGTVSGAAVPTAGKPCQFSADTVRSTVVVNAAGKITSVADCKQLLACVAHSVPNGFTVNAAGGFDVVDTDGGLLRLFVFCAATGEMAMVGLFPKGVMVASKQTARSPAVVGTATRCWDMQINASGMASSIAEDTSTVLTANATTNSDTRSRKSDGRVDSFSNNSPRTGLRSRTADSCKTSSGAATACSAIIAMPLPGFGFGVCGSAVAGSAFFGISTNMTAGTHSAANDATCFGANSSFNTTSQGGALTTAGAASTATLTAGPDIYGYTFSGTLTGRIWTGTVTKVATTQPTFTGGSGVFSVELGTTQHGCRAERATVLPRQAVAQHRSRHACAPPARHPGTPAGPQPDLQHPNHPGRCLQATPTLARQAAKALAVCATGTLLVLAAAPAQANLLRNGDCEANALPPSSQGGNNC